jgi:membrane fusion protein, multidrug efflux system
LKSAEARLQSAKAAVSQAHAMMSNAEINLGYTYIKAPANGYIGRIPMKAGSLVGRGEILPLTMLSDINEVYAYFSMSEVDFLQFKEATSGKTIEEKLNNVGEVELLLADNSTYEEKGKIETVEGQFNRTTGAISFRAVFPNKKGLLRSGNSGRVKIPSTHKEVFAIPQESTFELQDKVLVYIVNDSSQVISRPIHVEDQNSNYYFVRGGIKEGEKLVYTGLSRLRDGMLIKPSVITMDSLRKIKPL